MGAVVELKTVAMSTATARAGKWGRRTQAPMHWTHIQLQQASGDQQNSYSRYKTGLRLETYR